MQLSVGGTSHTGPQCPNCECPLVIRSHRRGLGKYLLSFKGIYPFRRTYCTHRFRVPVEQWLTKNPQEEKNSRVESRM
jgi:hypothetical protein